METTDIQPQPAEACSELLEDSAVDPQASAIFWNAYAVFVAIAIIAAVAVYWP